MNLSLYHAVVPSFIQILHSLEKLLIKAEEFCAEKGLPADQLIEARLVDDMNPFSYQISSAAWHSKGAIEAIHQGIFSPDLTPPPTDFAGLNQKVSDALSYLKNIDQDALNEFVGNPMRFEYGDFAMDFVAEDFLLSFSQPNFYFHATTAYDILRWRGLTIGKRDFLGHLRRLE